MTKAKIHAKSSAPAAADDVGVPAGNNAAQTPAAAKAAEGPPKARRIPLSVLALAGAGVAAAYGHFVLGMRLGPPLVMVALGGMTLALCAAALWRVIDPLTRDEVAAVIETRAPHRIRELEREKQAVLKAIKEIELDYQMRKISEADYREMVERYRARALRILGDLAAGDDYRALIERELRDRLAARFAAGVTDVAADVANGDLPAEAPISPVVSGSPTTTLSQSATLPASSSRACGVCGTPNDSDAQFCKKCGTNMTSSADLA